MIYLTNDARSCATRREPRDMAQEDHSMEYQVINLVRYIFPRGRCCIQFGRSVFTRPETSCSRILHRIIKRTILRMHTPVKIARNDGLAALIMKRCAKKMYFRIPSHQETVIQYYDMQLSCYPSTKS